MIPTLFYYTVFAPIIDPIKAKMAQYIAILKLIYPFFTNIYIAREFPMAEFNLFVQIAKPDIV